MIFIIISIIIGCIYLAFNRDENLTITYIKFESTPKFVIGINNQDRVVMYNPLNEEAKIFNLMMFNNKTLEEMSMLFISKAEEANYLNYNEINLTIITKNLEKNTRILNKIESSINQNYPSIIINTKLPTYDEMLTYSNEIAYDIENTYSEDDIYNISKTIENKIDLYIKNQLQKLNIIKLPLVKQKQLIETNYENGYFNDFELNSIFIDGKLNILEPSNYNVYFRFNDDLTYEYDIVLYLQLEYYRDLINNDSKSGIFEVYDYKYNLLGDKTISDYKNYFYRFEY